jgi:hypothetical protein
MRKEVKCIYIVQHLDQQREQRRAENRGASDSHIHTCTLELQGLTGTRAGSGHAGVSRWARDDRGTNV